MNKFLGNLGLRKLIELIKGIKDQTDTSIQNIQNNKVGINDIVDDTRNGLAPQVTQDNISSTPLSDGDLVLTYRENEGAKWSEVDIFEL